MMDVHRFYDNGVMLEFYQEDNGDIFIVLNEGYIKLKHKLDIKSILDVHIFFHVAVRSFATEDENGDLAKIQLFDFYSSGDMSTRLHSALSRYIVETPIDNIFDIKEVDFFEKIRGAGKVSWDELNELRKSS